MVLATWWYEDAQPLPEAIAGFSVECAADKEFLAAMTGLTLGELERRGAEGHRPYVARIHGEPAGYGWVAASSASIGELELRFELPPGNRYLWDFATLPDFRGRGVYPALLGEITRRECPPATRLWIIHAPENLPSGVGIARAGFQPVAEISYAANGQAALLPIGDGGRAVIAGQLLGIPLVPGPLDSCWACGGCACEHPAGSANPCRCAVHPGR